MSRKTSQRQTVDRKKAAAAGKERLVDIMLDAALEEFEPHFRAICKKLAEQAKQKGGESIGKFIVEFASKHADRQDEGEARRELMEMTRRLTEGAEGYMPPGMKETLDKEARDGADSELATPLVLEAEEDSRVVESDVAAAPGLVGAAEGAADECRPGTG